MNYYICSSDFLMHHGIKGQKWGVRRFQNYDGTLIGSKSGRGGKAQLAAKAPNIFERKKQEKEQRLKAQKAHEHKQNLEKESNNWANGGWTKDYNAASDKFNTDIKAINKKYEGKDLGIDTNTDDYTDMFAKLTDDGFSYFKEVDTMWQKHYSDAIKDNHSQELAKTFIDNAPFMKQYAEVLDSANQSRAINNVYTNLEKKYPNFDSFSQEKKDKMFFEEAERSGMDEYIFGNKKFY